MPLDLETGRPYTLYPPPIIGIKNNPPLQSEMGWRSSGNLKNLMGGGHSNPTFRDVLVLFRDPFWVAFLNLHVPRNTMNSKGFGDFREAVWSPLWLIFGPSF